MKFSSLALLTSLFTGASVAKIDYNGYRVYRVDTDSFMKNTHKLSKMELQTWNDHGEWDKDGWVDVVVKPENIKDFEAIGMGGNVMHHNLGQSIAEESRYPPYEALDASWWDSYHSYNDHLQFLKDLQAQFPQQSEIVTSGSSGQGRPITGIHFWGSAGKNQKPAVVFHSTVHAREWITTLTTEYFAYSLLSNYSTDAATKSYVDKYDFHIFPVVNPDGFTYTQTDDRLWRKNRAANSGSSCVGTDINRNWPYKWDVPGGASTDPCAEDYRGPSANSAVESQALTKYISGLQNTKGVQLYMDFHSYSQLFMTPYGYSCTAKVPNYAKAQSLASGAAAALKAVNGISYTSGPICSTIYKATGNSVDWATDIAKSTNAFAVELRDTGRYGFVLPARFIRPVAIETYAAVLYLLKNM